MHPESTPTWLIGPEIPPTQRIGTVLSGSYRLDAFLGQGMTGVTYNAWHLRQKQPYAVKLLHRELQPSHERVSRLRQDLRTLSGLRRFGFLPVELSFAPDGAPFLACELLTGDTLRSRLGRGPLPVLATGIVTAALARALGEAHQQGIVHGDLRPENVLLPSEAGREVEAGQPVLLDAALHHLRRRPIGLDESLPIGKLVYLAPEQASGEQQTADAAGDIFALGAILYECLTGRQAFAGPELEVVLEKLAAPPQKLALPREVGAPPGLGEALDEVIAKACARDPAERYASMAELLAGLDKAFSQCGLPLPPPDERVPIDTVKAQNRELRKRTVVVKKVVPLAPMTELPETSGVMSAAAFAHLSALMTSSSTPEPSEAAPASAPAGAAEPGADKPAEGKRITAKNRVVRRTVRARDLSRLLNQIESGQLDVAQAMALAAKAEDEPEPDDSVPEPVAEGKSEAQRIIEEGRAAVIARAEAAKKNRESETKERQQRDQAAAQEMQRRLLEQARQETLGRMRAEWELSRPVAKLAAKDLAAEPRPARAEAKPDPQQAELLAEAQRQAQRLEAERTDAERSAAEEAAKAQAEAQAAEAGRKEAARLEAELRAAERREAERAEAVRRQAELEIKARQLAEQAEQARAAKQAEAEARHKEAEEARQAAEAKQAEAAAAKQAAEASDEAALWEDGFDLLLSEEQPDRTIPPPIPAAAMRARTEAARRAEAEAERARAEAAAAAAAAKQASSDAAEIEQQVVAARRAQEEAAAARDREAAELAAAVEAAEDVRAQDQALFRQVMDAEKRAKVAEAARRANVARVTRVTQALQVIRQVQTLVEDESPAEPAAPAAATGALNSATNSADTGRFRRPLERPPGGERAEPVSAAAPASPLSSEITGRTAVPTLAASQPSAAETSSGYASFQVSPAAPAKDGSGAYTAAQLAAAGIRVPDPIAQSAQTAQPSQSTRSPARPAQPEPRADQSAGYSAAQLAAAGMRAPEPRADPSTGYTAAQLAAAGIRVPDPRADQSAGYTAAQLAAAGMRPPDPAIQAAPPGSTTGSSAWAVQPDPRADLSAGYSAAQLAAAGIRSPSQVMPHAMTPMIGQPLPSGMHPAMQLAKGGSTSMPHISGGTAGSAGDYSAMLSSAGMSGIMPPGMGAQPLHAPAHEPGGVTLTTRQLVATLAMTSVLSGVIGALIALLVLQNTYKPGESALPPATTAAGGPGGEAPPVARSDQPPESKSETPRPPVAPVAPRPAPPPVVSGPPDTLVLYRDAAALPPLRLTSVAAVGPPRPSQWTRPGGPAARPALPPGPGSGAKPDAATPGRPTPPDGKPAAENPPATDSKPGAPGGKPAVKPSADQVGLRNPFSK